MVWRVDAGGRWLVDDATILSAVESEVVSHRNGVFIRIVDFVVDGKCLPEPMA